MLTTTPSYCLRRELFKQQGDGGEVQVDKGGAKALGFPFFFWHRETGETGCEVAAKIDTSCDLCNELERAALHIL